MPIRPFLIATLLLAAAGCDSAPETRQSFRSPRGDYTILVDTADRGACCATRVTGRVDGFAPGKPAEIFEIQGIQEMSVAWQSPYSLVVTVCDAANIDYKPRHWNESLTQDLTLTILNKQPRRTPDGVTCDLPAM